MAKSFVVYRKYSYKNHFYAIQIVNPSRAEKVAKQFSYPGLIDPLNSGDSIFDRRVTVKKPLDEPMRFFIAKILFRQLV